MLLGRPAMSATVGRSQPKDAGERQAPVRGAVRLRAGHEHVSQDRRWFWSRWSLSGSLALNFHTAATYANVKPLVIRIDDVGRAEAVQYDATAYQPQPPELRYFLTQFIVKHFSRLGATVQREYPDSLLFLEPTLADATIAQNDQSRASKRS